jgi:hypothetical protein
MPLNLRWMIVCTWSLFMCLLIFSISTSFVFLPKHLLFSDADAELYDFDDEKVIIQTFNSCVVN